MKKCRNRKRRSEKRRRSKRRRCRKMRTRRKSRDTGRRNIITRENYDKKVLVGVRGGGKEGRKMKVKDRKIKRRRKEKARRKRLP